MSLAPSHRYTNEQILAQQGVRSITAHTNSHFGRGYTKLARFTVDIFQWPSWALPCLRESPIDKGEIIVKINMRAPVEDGRSIPIKVSSHTVERVLDAAAKRRRAGGGTATGKIGYVI